MADSSSSSKPSPSTPTEEQQAVSVERKMRRKVAFFAGLEGNVAFCEKEKLGWHIGDIDAMMEGAAQGGHGHLCQRAKEWGSVTSDRMAKGAARGGHMELVIEAMKWAEEMIAAAPALAAMSPEDIAMEPGFASYDDVLYGAAEGGHEDMCRFAKDNGAKNFDGMLWDGLKKGKANIYNLAFEWGAKDFYDAFAHAAAGGNVEACIFVKDVLKQTNFESMRSAAQEAGHFHLVEIANQWASGEGGSME